MKTKSLPAVFLVLFVIITLFSACKSEKSANSVSIVEKKATEENLREQFPLPDFGEVEISVYPNMGYLSAYISGASEAQYAEYISLCKQRGYTIEMSEGDQGFTAYNKDGYRIRAYYYFETIDVNINVLLVDMEKIQWPKSGIASQVPAPGSKTGKIEEDSPERFKAYVGDTPIDAFHEYVEKCYAAGFDINCERNDKEFVGRNDEGYVLGLNYIGFSAFTLSIEAPEAGADE